MKRLKIAPCFRASVRQDGVLELLVYDEIGMDFWTGEGITAKTFKQQIDAAGIYASILVRINSPGGDAFEGVAIGNLLKSTGKPVAVAVDGIAASAASVIAMCGQSISMAPNAMMMIHNAWAFCMGNSSDMAKMSDTLGKIDVAIAQTYVDRTGQGMDAIEAMMDAETWMSADEALKNGFCSEISRDGQDDAAMAMARRFKSLARFKQVPDGLKAEEIDPQCVCDCPGCAAGDCEHCTDVDCADPNCEDCPMQAAPEMASPGEPSNLSAPSNLSLYEARLAMLDRRV